MTSEDRNTKTVVDHLIAKSEMEETKIYLDSGRAHKDRREDALAALFVAYLRTWALGIDGSYRPLEDVRAEYRLRKIPPPYHLVMSEMETLMDRIGKAYDQMTRERRGEIGVGIVMSYLKDTNTPQ
ncbi:hypothetical protein [Mesorhizobium sp.]|uniref:hypothetical protein n=1 Tax=Mesorhizobium sp. TaxID=1871066 RepID=UPI0026015B80|nr:hypothetical protein [Mesorhizobium sp.]